MPPLLLPRDIYSDARWLRVLKVLRVLRVERVRRFEG
jgi:hypothetical protein